MSIEQQNRIAALEQLVAQLVKRVEALEAKRRPSKETP